MHQIRTQTFIAAPPLAVWEVLADFDRYAEWNPLNIRASGTAVPGAKIPMVFQNLASPGKTISQTVTLVACEQSKALAWAGSVPLLFKGRHSFSLNPEGEGTRVHHHEDLGGLITLAISRDQILRDFLPAYEAVNHALAERLAA